MTAFLLFTGCSWEPSDRDAVNLVESYYLFSYGGKKVDVEIIGRGEYIRKYKCYPIKCRISTPGRGSYEKTFYFFKNEAGNVEVREYQFVIMQ